MTAIEELERLASDMERRSPELTEHLLAIATRLRAEVRERERKAFKAGYVAASSTPDCNAFDRIQREAVAAAREYTEGEKETGK